MLQVAQTERIGLRLPRETKQLAEQAARAAGWDLSTWLRHIVEIAASAELEAAAAARDNPVAPRKPPLRQRPGG